MTTAAKLLAFGIVTVTAIALAGPMPTVVNGILVLIIAALILTHSAVFTDALTTSTKALKA
jgi:hypothetical protein